MSWRWEFGFLMLGVSAINFYSCIQINRAKEPIHKKLWIALAVIFSMLPLVYYKYSNFLIQSFSNVVMPLGFETQIHMMEILLPVGISFFTFQALSYTIDVYQSKVEPETNLPRFLTFIAFFPQLIAGPIERADNMLVQFKQKHDFKYQNFVEGSKLFIWGLFKKIVIADRLAVYSDMAFNSPEAYSGPTMAVATVFFAFQIYCDFSGYSDMAIGIARILGFKLMQNFNLPYLANSISDFWKRWHISLSSWFGSYVYLPLGGNRVKLSRWVLNISAVFLLSGLWHGASWTFIIWGALHASYYFVEHLGSKFFKLAKLESIVQQKWYKVFKILSVFLMVCFAWIFFRANSIKDAFFITESIFSWEGNLTFGSSTFNFAISLMLILFLIVVQVLQYRGKLVLYFSEVSYPRPLVWLSYSLLLIGIAILGMSSNAFIYFQF